MVGAAIANYIEPLKFMKRISLLLILVCPLMQNLLAQTTPSPWPQTTKEMHPWTRWWWMGNAVDDRNTAKLLESYNKVGLGGVEITPIYGAIGYESRYLQFLSPQWMSALKFTVTKAKTLDMGVDMNTGTGWPFGGPQIKPENAAAKIIIQTYKLNAGETLSDKLIVDDPKQQRAGAPLQALTAYGNNGEVIDLLDKVNPDGSLNWKPEKGKYTIYAAFSGKTMQIVKRAAPGGEGLVMDHLSKAAVDTYLQRFDQAFGGKSPGVGSFFNDSYEVFGATWSPDLFDSFIKYKGYDLRLHLKELAGVGTDDSIARVKSDYRETMSRMLLDDFTLNWTAWAHKYGSLSRNQSHGSPGNLLDLYGAVDIPECETFGSTKFDIPGLRRDASDVRSIDPDPMMMKFATSAAHVNGKPFATSETFTWLTEHFKGALSQCKPEVEQVFLAGVNHVYFHGTTYSPDDVPFPGWLFYASTNFVTNNSWWPHLSGLNGYITRCQSVLQAGKSDNEILLYWPIYDTWNNANGMEMTFAVNNTPVWLHKTAFYQDAQALQTAGYAFDFASDKVLAGSSVVNGLISTNAAAQTRRVLIIPQCTLMPEATLVKIIALAKSGATVIFQQLPTDVPGLNDLQKRRTEFKALLAGLNFTDAGADVKVCAAGSGQILLSADLQKALQYKGITGEALTQTGLKFIRRVTADGKYYYIVNHTAKAIDTSIPLNISASSVQILDPQSGAFGQTSSLITDGRTQVRVQLQPGEAWILKVNTTATATPMAPWKYIDKTGAVVVLNNPWDLHFTTGGPFIPADQNLTKLTSWTDLADVNAVNFSGSGEYTTTFNIDNKSAADYVLNLGKVCESAHVWINGQDAGIFWSIPFSARIGKYLVPGKNTLKIEVDNLMANHVRYIDQHGVQWRKFHEINFVNIAYQPFDASNWAPMPSGLLGPVTITPIQ